MRRIIPLILLTSSITSQAQDTQGLYNQLPIILTIQFHQVAMPLQKLSGNFSNIGIGIGTEVSLTGSSQRWAQSVQLVWHSNKYMGNGLALYTQTVTRPTLSGNVFGEVKLGVGYQYLYRPTDSFSHENGQWTAVKKRGKGMLMLPASAGIGLLDRNRDSAIAPFLNYQWMILKGYNRSIPMVPQSTIILGNRIHHD